MTREFKTAQEIGQAINELVFAKHKDAQLGGVLQFTPVRLDQPSDDGCNWTVMGVSGCSDLTSADSYWPHIQAVQARFNLE